MSRICSGVPAVTAMKPDAVRKPMPVAEAVPSAAPGAVTKTSKGPEPAKALNTRRPARPTGGATVVVMNANSVAPAKPGNATTTYV